MRFQADIPDEPISVGRFTRQKGPDDAHHLDVRFVVRGFDEFGVGRILVAGSFAECGRVGEAQEEMIRRRLLYADRQGTAGMCFSRTHFEAHPFEAGPGHAVLDHGLAKIKAPQHQAIATFKDGAGFESGQEGRGILGPQH